MSFMPLIVKIVSSSSVEVMDMEKHIQKPLKNHKFDEKPKKVVKKSTKEDDEKPKRVVKKRDFMRFSDMRRFAKHNHITSVMVIDNNNEKHNEAFLSWINDNQTHKLPDFYMKVHPEDSDSEYDSSDSEYDSSDSEYDSSDSEYYDSDL
jgi:hypothetical protein